MGSPISFLKKSPIVVLLLMISIASQSAWAVPTAFTYQGSLKQNGVPLNGSFPIEFRLTNVDGSQLYWTSGAQSVPVTEGLYKMDLTPTGVNWDTIDPYIEVRVNGTTLLPREKVTLTFYSQAARALLPGAPPIRLNIPDAAPNALLIDVANAANSQEVIAVRSMGTGALMDLRQGPTVGSASSKFVVSANGRVGIGFNAPFPSGLLHLRADGYNNMLALGGTVTDNVGWMSFYSNSSPNQQLIVGGKEGIRFQTGSPAAATEVATLGADGTLSVSDGGINFRSEPSLGIYRVGTNNMRIKVGGSYKAGFTSTVSEFWTPVLPGNDGGSTLGRSGSRWQSVWAQSGVIQTSSSRNKRDIREISMDGQFASLIPFRANPLNAVKPKTAQTKRPLPATARELSFPNPSFSVPRGIVFKWKDNEGKVTDEDVIGFNGDDLPMEAHAIREDGTRDPDNFYTSAVIGLMAARIHEQDKQIEQLKEAVRELSKRIGTGEVRFDRQQMGGGVIQ